LIEDARAIPPLASEFGLDLAQETLDLVRFADGGRPRHVLRGLKGQDLVLPEKLAELLPELSRTQRNSGGCSSLMPPNFAC
jgi:hypothetical protein